MIEWKVGEDGWDDTTQEWKPADFNLTPLPDRRELQVVLSVQPAESAFADESRRYDLSSLATARDTDRTQRELGTQSLTESIIEYLVWRSGRDAAKRMIKEINRHDTWPQLIQDGLGIAYRDVDHGWWQFAVQRFAAFGERSPDQIRAELGWMLQLEEHALETRDHELFRSLRTDTRSSGG